MKKGFTLIELLVVIAIIGILSSVVLASLNASRVRAADTALKAAMQQVANQAEVYRDGSTSFGTSNQAGVMVCTEGVFADVKITEIQANILTYAAPGATFTCYSDSILDRWAISVSELRGGGSWCIDNSNGSSSTTAQSSGICS